MTGIKEKWVNEMGFELEKAAMKMVSKTGHIKETYHFEVFLMQDMDLLVRYNQKDEWVSFSKL